ncbi:MAG: AMIN domain-containing protein, partial [Gemmatimonadota bacterium]
MISLRAVLVAAMAAVQGLSVVSAGDRTDVLIETGAEVSIQHQSLNGPPRIVVDMAGAEFGLPRSRFLDINRGGVVALRSSQFQQGVVRVVVDLSQAADYEVSQADGVVRVSFPNPNGPFQAWTSESVPAPAPEAAPEPVGRPATPGRPADRPTAVPVAVSQMPVVQAPPEQPPITVEFREVPIVDVLNTFADFSGRSIVPGMGVSNQVITAAIRGQPWDEAMRAILEAQGLVANELASGIIMV